MSMDAGDALVQTVKIMWQGAEYAIKFVGKTIEEIEKTIAFIMALLQKNQDKPSIGKTNLIKMLQSGQPLKTLTLKQDDLQRFASLAKQYGVPFTPVKDTSKDTNQLDVLVRENDAESINRIFEVLNKEKVSDEPKKKYDPPTPKLQEPKSKTPENNKEMDSSKQIQIETTQPVSLPASSEERLAKEAQPIAFFIYDEKTKQTIPITPQMQQDMQKAIHVKATVKEEKPSVIAKINQAKKDLQKQFKSKGKNKSKNKAVKKSTTERS